MFLKILKSLFMPTEMIRYRTMGIVFSIAIFLLASYLLALPQMTFTQNNRYLIVDEQNPYDLLAFSDMSEGAIAEIKAFECQIENGYINGECQDSVQEAEPYIFPITYQDEPYNIYFVFDLYNVFNPDATPNYDIQERFNATLEADDNKILVVIYQNRIHYQTPSQRTLKGKILEYPKNFQWDFSEIQTGKDISYKLMDLYIPDIKTETTFNTFLSTVVYPAALILIVWLIFKGGNTLYSFKEFYNVAAIASLTPLLLIFALSWVFPSWSLLFYYSTIFGIYYLYVIFRIQNKTKTVD